MLFIYGHALHVTMDAAGFCWDHGIIYHLLIKNASFMLQNIFRIEDQLAQGSFCIESGEPQQQHRQMHLRWHLQDGLAGNHAVKAFKCAGLCAFNVEAVECGCLSQAPKIMLSHSFAVVSHMNWQRMHPDT